MKITPTLEKIAIKCGFRFNLTQTLNELCKLLNYFEISTPLQCF